MANANRYSRRGFLTRGAAVAVPYVVPASALGRAGTIAPSERITLGLVGCGLHGAGWNLDQVFRCADAQVVAVCDVDDDRCQKARAKVEGHYSRQLGRGHADR